MNSIMLGALIGCTDIVAIDSLVEAMRSVFSARQHHLLEVNRSAMLAGEARAREAVAAKV